MLCENMEKFCREYVVDYSPSKAAARAGYCNKGYGAELLKKEKVVARICEIQEECIRNSLLDNKNRVLREIWGIYEKAMQATPVKVWDKERKEYVETGEYQFDDKTAMKCLEFIAKLGGMLSDKETEKTGKKESFEIVGKVGADED